MNEPDIDAILRGGKSRKWWIILSGAAAVVVIAAVVTFLLTRPDGEEIAVEPERAESMMGRLSTQVDLSGSALAERSATLSFEVAGLVASVGVSGGDAVRAGDALGTLDGAEAQRRVETAEVQLRLAELRLEDLMAGPESSAVAQANQAIASAKSQVVSAEQALALLSEPPSAADLASAEQAVANALALLSSEEEALAELMAGPSEADLASAEQAVATALGQISSAEQDLAQLLEPPGAADLASAEQAVANALALLSSEEEALAELMAGPSDAELAALRSAVTQAEVRLAEATTYAEELQEDLSEAYDDFCDRYIGLRSSDEVIRDTCDTEPPLSEERTAALKDSFEDRSTTFETYATSLIDANVAYVAAEADRESAVSGLASTGENLTNLLQSVTEEVIYQAEQSAEAARASHEAAAARLTDLQSEASEEDVFQARQAVAAARANHTAAAARLNDLRSAPEEEDLFQAEQALEAAKANHAAAVARLEDLLKADEDEIESAQASLESAQASLSSAQAQYDDLVAGPTENAIAQQQQDVRLAELSVEEARADLADLTLFAPFDGVVEAINVQPGDRVSVGLAAFTLNTSNRMLIALTVTEEELLDLEVGQTGVASFDAIEGVQYPVQVESVSRVPNAEQGVVTYDVEARILGGADLADTASQTAPGGIRPGGGFGGGAAGGGPFSGIELPEGVTIQQVRQALLSGGPLPEGVTLPEELLEMVQSLRSGAGVPPGRGGPGVAGGQQSADGQADAIAQRPVPAPGMSASVTILTEVREETVLAPTSAVRQLDGAWFVVIPAPGADGEEDGHERVFVEIGVSDGTNVEILSGIEAGMVVLIGADGAGIAFAATQQQPSALPGLGGFGPAGGGGGRPPGGGGGGR